MIPPKKTDANDNRVFFHLTVQDVQKKLRRLGYKIDIETNYYYIYRNSDFPFQRVNTPKTGLISLVGLMYLLDSINVKYEYFKNM